ncbi:MAG: hypothetical protein AAF270_15615 [Pseudomonadota bacterium]
MHGADGNLGGEPDESCEAIVGDWGPLSFLFLRGLPEFELILSALAKVEIDEKKFLDQKFLAAEAAYDALRDQLGGD